MYLVIWVFGPYIQRSLSKASIYAASDLVVRSADFTETIFDWFADFTTYFDNYQDSRIFHKLGSACKVNSIQYLLTTESEATNQTHSNNLHILLSLEWNETYLILSNIKE